MAKGSELIGDVGDVAQPMSAILGDGFFYNEHTHKVKLPTEGSPVVLL